MQIKKRPEVFERGQKKGKKKVVDEKPTTVSYLIYDKKDDKSIIQQFAGFLQASFLFWTLKILDF